MNLEEGGKLQRVVLQNPVGPINQENYKKTCMRKHMNAIVRKGSLKKNQIQKVNTLLFNV